VNKAQLIERIMNNENKPYRVRSGEVKQVVELVFESITEGLEANEDVTISGFGTFKAVDKAARRARNPRTGEPLAIPAKRGVKFKAGTRLKEAVDN